MNNITIETITGEQIKTIINDESANLDTEYGLPVIEIDGDSYLVASNEDKADTAVAKYIRGSLCYFSPTFLYDMTGLPLEVFEALANCDFSDHEAYFRLIQATCGIEDFIETAIDCDGRGHFLSSYDGKEREIDGYFLYKI